MTKKLSSLIIRIHNQQQIIKFTEFLTFHIDGDQKTLTVADTDKLLYIVNVLSMVCVTKFVIE